MISTASPMRQPARDQVLERGPLDVLHRDQVAAVGLAAVVDADDVRVLEPRRGLGLAPEALDELGVLGEPLVQELKRDLAAEHLVVGQPDVGHPAAARAGDERVAVADPLSVLRAPSSRARFSMTWVAIGPAISPPKQPWQRSSMTATAICGSSAGREADEPRAVDRTLDVDLGGTRLARERDARTVRPAAVPSSVTWVIISVS